MRINTETLQALDHLQKLVSNYASKDGYKEVHLTSCSIPSYVEFETGGVATTDDYFKLQVKISARLDEEKTKLERFEFLISDVTNTTNHIRVIAEGLSSYLSKRYLSRIKTDRRIDSTE